MILSFLIVFDIRDAEIVIVAVYHSSRRPNYWMRRLGHK